MNRPAMLPNQRTMHGNRFAIGIHRTTIEVNRPAMLPDRRAIGVNRRMIQANRSMNGMHR